MYAEKSICIPEEFRAKKIFGFISLVNQFKSEIILTNEKMHLNGKSILGTVTFFLNMKTGGDLKICGKGEDAEKAVEILSQFLLSPRAPELDYWQEETMLEMMKASLSVPPKHIRTIAKPYFNINRGG
ncbi:PTS HPr component family protein [Melghiribacillus thermohalophilus]|uniref:PTS HPr component family protein n=1 Tax=Melghiribacillus thermohalophilus TaxID=1324956 RepID=A0A4R3NI16_9BACI|nr:HPr family phosphocarrier protein [Melghiribacillus thermohalophilus]TCT26932.1 PTS HPr component family protein [Melghiribacillus thermohalophilus]